jgi:MscS family membrane protein
MLARTKEFLFQPHTPPLQSGAACARHRYWRLLLLLVMVVVCGALTIFAALPIGIAQETPTPGAVSALLPDHDLRSPRQTVATFLAAMDPADGEIELSRAIKTLNTSGIDEFVRQERAEEVAVKLYAVLSSKGFSPSRVPTNSSVDAIQISDVAGYGIYLERSGQNWYFSPATVGDVPSIFREIEPTLSKREMRALGNVSHPWLTLRTYIPEPLKHTTFLIEDWQWLAGIVSIVLVFVVQVVVLRLLRIIVTRLTPPRFAVTSSVDLRPLGRPTFVVVFTSAVQLFISSLGLEADFHAVAVAWISTARICALAVLGIYLVESLGARLQPASLQPPTALNTVLYPLVQKALWLLVLVVAAVRILSVHGVDVSGLVAGLGLGGLAFALAAKDTVENLFGSVAILFDQPFRVGDNISVSGVTGVVEQIGLRSTRLRTPENSLVSLPNSKIISSHVDNLGARRQLRTRIILQIAYNTPPASIEALCTGLRELLHSHPRTKKDSVAVYLHEFNPSGLGVLIQFYLVLAEWREEQRHREELFLAFLRLLELLRIEVAPQSLPMREPLMVTSSPLQEPRELSSTHFISPAERAPLDGVTAARSIPVPWRKVPSEPVATSSPQFCND